MGISQSEIEALIALFEASDWRRVELIADGVELRLSKDAEDLSPRAMPAPATAAAAPAAPAGPAPSGHIVEAPSLGTFYRAPRPGEPPFVTVGKHVEAGQDLCLIEVMKLFTAVQAPISGTVLAVHAADGDLVEFGQPLLSLDPDG